MNELLDVARGEFTMAQWRTDQESGHVWRTDEEMAKAYFNRFLELRSTMQTAQSGVKDSCILFGWCLKEIQETRLYEYVCRKSDNGSYQSHVGYTSFYKFCKDAFGLKERTAARMVAVAKEFCGLARFDEEGEVQHIGVDLPYVNFSYSQLSEMVGIDDKNKLRIPTTCSARNIAKLKALYKEYTPPIGTTYEDDLAEYKKRKAEEAAKKNEKKNRIHFTPARTLPTLAGCENPPAQGENGILPTSAGLDLDDGEDERDVITPAERTVSFEAIRSGLMAQLDLLGSLNPGWNVFSERVKTALEKEDAMHLVEYSRVRKLRSENIRLVVAASQSNVEVNDVPMGERLNLKNEKERKAWLENFRSWGVWINVPDVSRTYYRYNFVNGTAMIVCVAKQYWSYSSKREARELKTYHVLDEDHKEFDSFGLGGVSKTVEWLTKHGKEI